MLKKYKKKDGDYGYDKGHYIYSDIFKKYYINTLSHGFFYYSTTNLKNIWYKGYFNMGYRCGHWLLSYEKFKFKYYL